MLITAMDPSLLFYKHEDWQKNESHCFERFYALALHRKTIREYNQLMAISNEIASLLWQFFPWNKNYKNIPELRDLRNFISQDLQRAHYVESRDINEIEIIPEELLCKHVEETEVFEAWNKLICCIFNKTLAPKFDGQVATWDMSSFHEIPESLFLRFSFSDQPEDINEYLIPIVFNEETWARRFIKQDWWPDLRKYIKLYFITEISLKSYPGVREKPIPHEFSGKFMKSLEKHCKDKNLRISLVKALTKRVYGILDRSLNDEPFKDVRRFRVTDFWRVHYRIKEDLIIFEEFGPHGIGGIE